MTTRVVNRYRERGSISIQRGTYQRPSKWGNPHRLRDRSDPIAVVECLLAHALHLEESGLIDEVQELRGHVLECTCAPARCHGDTLARCADADDAREELAAIIEDLEAELAKMVRERDAQGALFG